MSLKNYPPSWATKIKNAALYSVDNGLSGAVIAAFIDGKKILGDAYGYQRIYNEKERMPVPQPMRVDTIFDMASLTKIFATTFSYLKLVDEKLLSIEDKVCAYLPAFKGGDKEKVSVKQLLQHNSGMPSSFHFYNPADVPPEFYSQSRQKTIELLPLVPLLNPPGKLTVYSDLNFILLGMIIEKITSMRQDDFVSSYIYKPLGLEHTGYMLQGKGIPQNRFEATERCGNTRDGRVYFPNIRTKTIQGETHDETAYYSMKQVSGHAGLFSTADDLSVLCQLILDGGSVGSFRLCSEETVRLFTRTLNIDGSYALGFQIPGVRTEYTYGSLLPGGGDAIGHTGWTGNCFVIDFKHRSILIILTNRKHSPVIPVGNDLHTFEGDLLPASFYSPITQLFYGGFLSV